MKFLAGRHNGKSGVWLLVDDPADTAVNLTLLMPAIGTDLAALADGRIDTAKVIAVSREARRKDKVPLTEIEPTLPIANPGKILCLGLNYLEHIKEGGGSKPTSFPVFFMRSRTSLVASGQPMLLPLVSEELDFEAELMIVIGRAGRYIKAERGLEHVFGYTTFNDGSVRDFQKRTPQWTAGKNFDATGAVGPVVVTPDELPDGAHGVGIRTRIDGEVMQESTTADMLFSVADIIAAASEFATLEPGDLIATGTPPGVGFGRTPPRWLQAGEVVEVEIDGIGTCRNPVVAEEPE
ncbi:MAG: 5-oxopent-3-ene-1,2,5-tricarboxylate decarboxylase [Gammaproteobacteria bacterium]|nr:MAG: 5-oxopent-3-ene-1,2,5-tricarboxylate decarboxylase [Gammaproteobacteria bacterium]